MGRVLRRRVRSRRGHAQRRLRVNRNYMCGSTPSMEYPKEHDAHSGHLHARRPCGSAAQARLGTLRIGVLNDMSGVYSDDQGPGSVIAAQMAVEDYGAKAAGKKVEVVFRRPPE